MKPRCFVCGTILNSINRVMEATRKNVLKRMFVGFYTIHKRYKENEN
jgi:serine phosphatase RsbU (regulator of sigma subunit)